MCYRPTETCNCKERDICLDKVKNTEPSRKTDGIRTPQTYVIVLVFLNFIIKQGIVLLKLKLWKSLLRFHLDLYFGT
jgi:hypothetical protein